MKRLNHEQIEELNKLLVDHSETITAFYDEGIEYGLHKGCRIGAVSGAIGSVVGMTLAYGVIKIISRKKKNENEEES